MVHTRMEVALNMHIGARRPWVGDSLYRSDLVTNLHVGRLARVRRMEGLVIGEAVQVLVVLIIDLHVILLIVVCFHVVE